MRIHIIFVLIKIFTLNKGTFPMLIRSITAASLLIGAAASAETIKFAPGEGLQEKVQEAFITAPAGTTFEFAPGRYEFEMGLSLDLDKCTIKGAGMDKTVWTFKMQDAGSEGLLVTADGITLEDFAIEDTRGNAFKSNAANDLTIRRVRTEWTGGPKTENGAYGLYPVNGTNVLVEECVVIGASDAGVYVGQSKNVIVRRNRVEYNVAGIEIENCHHSDVYENIATNNTGGILVFDMPGLPVKDGQNHRVFHNKVFNNNTPNFAPPGNTVAGVPAGTGLMVMANYNVELFENDVRDHGTCNVMLTSWLATFKPYDDPAYNTNPEGIHVHHNTFGPCGNNPGGLGGVGISNLTGTPIPDVIWDGIVDEKKLVDGKLPAERGIYVHSNKKEGGETTVANLGGLKNLTDFDTSKVIRDPKQFEGKLPGLRPVVIPWVK
jgi:parallel beta-helix repeat protein